MATLNLPLSNIRRIVTQGGPNLIALASYTGRLGEFLLDPTTGNILYMDGTTEGGTLIAGTGGGGLTGFTGRVETDAPNDSVNASVLTASGGTMDEDIVLVPGGVGGLALTVANGDSSGGNKRGQYAVDLQIFAAGKNSPTQIASGNYSFACGTGNTASGNQSHVEGWLNTAQGDASHAEGNGSLASDFAAHAEGGGTTASGQYAHSEGVDTTASGHYSHAEGSNTQATNFYAHAEGTSTIAGGQASHAGGYGCEASGDYSFAHGIDCLSDGVVSFATGQNASTRGVLYMQAYAPGKITTTGDQQAGRLLLKGHASDGSVVQLTSDGGAPGTINQFVVPVDASFAFTVTVLGRDPGSAASAMYTFTTLIKNTGTGMDILSGTTTTATKLWADSPGADAWSCVGSVDLDNAALAVKVQGDNGVDVHWIAEVRSLELVIPDSP